ncbi:hypothetical protein [Longimicrobium sp.]|uniref:hypothetical protein n=1 Tax=Longimicrobium sp. TaxID=2029185 RepID=UPI003B3B10D9
MSRTGDTKAAAAPEKAEGRDYRTVPVEVIRRFAQDETELTSIRHVAGEVGLGRTTLHKFVAGETVPHPRVRRLLALWYLRRNADANGAHAVRPDSWALVSLLASSCVPDDLRADAAREILDVLERYATRAQSAAGNAGVGGE